MAKTRNDWVYRALKNLGALPQGQDPSDEDFNAVNDLVDGIVEQLIARDIYFLQDADVIPEEAFIPLGHVLTWAAAPVFDMHNDASLAAFAQKAELDLQKMQATRPTYQPLEVMPY